MYDLANNDLVICDRQTRLSNFDIKLKFADKLENLAKALVAMSSKCCEHATEIRWKISEAEDRKCIANQEIFLLGEVTEESEKCAFIQNKKTLCSNRIKSDPDKLALPSPLKRQHIGTIYILTDEEGEDHPGDIYTKFTYAKGNNNTKELFKYSECGKCFRDSHEL